MNFTAEQPRFAQQLPRIVLVAALHVLGAVILASATRHHMSAPDPGPLIVNKVEPERPKPPEVTPPPQPKNLPEPPKVTIPRPEVEVTPAPAEKTPAFEFVDKVRPPIPPHPGGEGNQEAGPRVTPVPHAAPVTVAAVVDARNCAKPEYPTRAARLGETGTVTLSMLIGIDGHVIDAKVDKSSGHKELDLAARQGLSLCKFKPGTIDGVPQQLWTKIQYAWEIEE